MNMTTKVAALHIALWGVDRRYRIWWQIWPPAAALLICSWIYVDRQPPAAPATAASWARPVGPQSPPTTFAPLAKMPSPTSLWSAAQQADASRCLFGTEEKAIVEACSRLINSGPLQERQLVQIYPQRAYNLRFTDPERAMADYNAALKIQPELTPALVNRAWLLMARSDYAAAIPDLDKAIANAHTANKARAYYYRGFGYLKLKQPERALDDLNFAVGTDPGNADAYFSRGEALQALKRHDLALRDFDEFSKRSPRDASGIVGRASVFEETERYEEALLAYDRALRRDPDNTAAREGWDRLR